MDDKPAANLRDCASNLFRGVKKAEKQAEEMLRQVKALHSDMRRTEANLRATERALQQTERKAGRLHRKLRRQNFRGEVPGELPW